MDTDEDIIIDMALNDLEGETEWTTPSTSD